MARLVYGVGFNNADYKIAKCENGKQVWMCPFYRKWKAMLERSHGTKVLKSHPTYKDVSTCKEWHTFSNFREWMITQDWEGKDLDKDLLVEGNKVYSPQTCVFVDSMTNQFTKDGGNTGGLMLGCTFVRGKFHAKCSNPFTGKREHLGCFTDELEAHLAWKIRKHELALKLAELQTDERVAQALRTRYL
jgi:hypothetical protein